MTQDLHQSYFGPRPEPDQRTAGDDVELRLVVRRANLEQLERGVVLGVDLLTHQKIELRLARQSDGTHGLEVVTNPIPLALTPEPVDVERLP